MGRKAKPLFLSEEQRQELLKSLSRTDSIKYARRCKIILLKSSTPTLSNVRIGEELKVQPVTVDKWLRRYRQQGLQGLQSKPIPGRPTIFDPIRDKALVEEQVKKSRQRLKIAHAAIQKAKGRQMSIDTLRTFLKSLAHDSADYV